MPRVECKVCGRGIAAGLVAGRPAKGRVWRHDPTEQPSGIGDFLVSCTGSLEIVDLPRPGEQLALDLGVDTDELEDAPLEGIDTIALF
ncbi:MULTISPECIES: hypothetical protein [Streptomyces]|uniref:Uncharacterized protein n=1 Tax=Streptomyces plicatus TaxID=1922 RepID=A0ABW1Y4R9_STRPL|nr:MULTISPECIES: hypothetical protein [Streptomyces]RIH60582.1 hypothetical protein D3C59_17960 [Streptomyces sp. SHP22-7]MBJ6622164.1 hypothetical protein [Streptomyces sp. DHE17-7]RSS66213.1 hypothetical protein EF907_15650 [Streptomyces sp. WAC06273]GGZ81697.1 hypothetical protein GCM10010301_63560 [Streptomyces plicatus]GHC36302.1 hypothetical protein GCM10010308_63420 [Streptomyces vinaceusdrappus]